MLNVPPPKKKKKMSKLQNLKFYNSLYKFGRHPSYEYACILGANLLCTFRQDGVWSFFSIWFHVNENENDLANIPNLKFRNFGRDPR